MEAKESWKEGSKMNDEFSKILTVFIGGKCRAGDVKKLGLIEASIKYSEEEKHEV